MDNVVIVSGVRTPIGSFGGSLKDIQVKDLAAHVLKGVTEKVKYSPEKVDEVILGVCCQAQSEEVLAPVIARQAVIDAGFPVGTVSVTLDRACCSGTAAVQLASRSIISGAAESVIAAGAECMSLTPYVLHDLRWGSRMKNVTMRDPLMISYRGNPVARDAGEVAMEYGITRDEQDDWAILSQKRYVEAKKAGKFADEIMPVTISNRSGTRIFAEDEFPKPEISKEKLSSMPTVYGSLTITAGNAPGLNDGAVALLLTSSAKAKAEKLAPLASVVDAVSVADYPKNIPVVPAYAIQKVLKKNGLKLEDISLLEINEAFAAMPLTSSKILAEGDKKKLSWIQERTNVNGGSIAIGHPVGATGARIVLTLINELRRRGGGYGIAAICGGMAQGDAVLVRV